MALQGSGEIRFSQIIAEFGSAPNPEGGSSLGGYRISEDYGDMENIPLDTGIPQSGEIRFSDFYSKQLNVVIDYYTGKNERRVIARNRYNNSARNGKVHVVGGYRGKPSNSGGTRVIIHVNKKLGSEYDGSRGLKCALRTGSWDTDTNLDLWIGEDGGIAGTAGAGGAGGNRRRAPTDGKRGSSGLGVEYPLDIWNYGFIAGGGGGGGGGKGEARDVLIRSAYSYTIGDQTFSGRNQSWDRRRKGGGGGSGGQGYTGGPPGESGGDGGAAGEGGSQAGPGNPGEGGGDGAGGGGFGGTYGNDGGDGRNSGAGGGHKGRSIVIEGPGHGDGKGSVTYKVTGTLYGPVITAEVF